MSGEAVDPELYNLLSTEVGKTRAAEDRVFSERIYWCFTKNI
jgi:hypothetical protein